MPDIVLATLNARYHHASFGLRYLFANLGQLQERTKLLEFSISDTTPSILAEILAQDPKVVGLGVYIWNIEPTTRLVSDLRRLRPNIRIVLGGPEVSYEAESLDIVQLADHVISGEADLAFSQLCCRLLGLDLPEQEERPPEKFLFPKPPTFDQLYLPYDFYTDEDLANRVIYVEASRGCPFTCEFCLSSLEIPVRAADLDAFLAAMQRLIDRGAMQFKFVDRTFNLNLRFSQAILQFFLERYRPGMFFHFEMIPDRLPEALRATLAKFPAGAVQLEIGVQTWNDEVGKRISRKQDNAKLSDNFRFLRGETGVHIHADLIIGLPGETLESFAAGFDALYRLRPQEIQVGILKRLRGTPIARHDDEWEMIYSQHPPYEILSNKLLDFATIHRLRRFARYWDLIGNSGNFVSTLQLLIPENASPFGCFSELCDWLFAMDPRTHGVALSRLFELLFDYLTTHRFAASERQRIAETMWSDYLRGGRRDRPAFLREFSLPQPPDRRSSTLPARQARHQTDA